MQPWYFVRGFCVISVYLISLQFSSIQIFFYYFKVVYNKLNELE